ncbi:MAG TPA: YaiI/YqxD family protein [Halanaerobiales bacterium]|nr:YaiI/YqxD family protein [Halanaerobiales bacterium]
MRIIIDGDACPVIDLAESIAHKFNIELILFCDYNHDIKLNYGRVVKVDQSYQSVDMKIINFAKRKDIIITDDYGLASLALSKKASAINSKGKIYTDKNIDTLLMKRHINKKIRRAGGRHPTAKKRSKKDDEKFKINLIQLIKDIK